MPSDTPTILYDIGIERCVRKISFGKFSPLIIYFRMTERCFGFCSKQPFWKTF